MARELDEVRYEQPVLTLRPPHSQFSSRHFNTVHQPTVIIPDPDHRMLDSDVDIYLYLLDNAHICRNLLRAAEETRSAVFTTVYLDHRRLLLPIPLPPGISEEGLLSILRERVTLIAWHLLQENRHDPVLIAQIILDLYEAGNLE